MREVTVEDVAAAALADLDQREEDEPCRAVHGVAVLEALGFDDEGIRGEMGWKKLAGRPCGKVREFYEYARGRIPEERRHVLGEFAKRVKPL